MANRRYYRQQGERFENDQGHRQPQQFERGYREERDTQMGEAWGRDYADEDFGGRAHGDDRRQPFRGDSGAGYDRNMRQGPSRPIPAPSFTSGAADTGARNYASFTGDDFGGRDFSGQRAGYGYGGRSDPYSAYGAGNFGAAPGRHNQHEDRGFFERAGDEVASWFGDDDAARRREADHRGYGPANYTRSDDRILEDTCDRLTQDWAVDGRKIQVSVSSGEVTLDGTVTSRRQKRRAEDCADSVSGVKHVQNNLRVELPEGQERDEPIAFI